MINIVAVVIGGSVNEDVLAMIGIVDRSSSIAFGTCRSVCLWQSCCFYLSMTINREITETGEGGTKKRVACSLSCHFLLSERWVYDVDTTH